MDIYLHYGEWLLIIDLINKNRREWTLTAGEWTVSWDISRDEASCGITDVVSDLLKKNSFAYHAESLLSKFLPSSEYFDWERRKDEVVARRLFLHLVVQKNFPAKLKNRRQCNCT